MEVKLNTGKKGANHVSYGEKRNLLHHLLQCSAILFLRFEITNTHHENYFRSDKLDCI